MNVSDTDIAIIGMAARVPGARNIDEFWRNLRDGLEAVRPLTDEELLKSGVSPQLLADPRYVKSAASLEEMEFFDAEFFGFSPKEAAIMDPQHRHFLECTWEALENAGHLPETFPGPIGVYGGCGMGAYFIFNLLSNRSLIDSVGMFLLRHTGNDKDFLTTRVSYLLNLTGPSISVQTACSTSLVAVHLACQSLLSGECDMALAGGVTIEVPHRQGYLYQENEILSPDGHCRSFDHRSKGTIFGSGAGVVVLRRLRDALEDNDHVHAVIKGSAINNDGAGKIGYLAPSVDGQAAAIAEALAVAGVSADSIEFVECHGTGTPVGDPIEIAALTQAFRASTKRTGYCGVGSVKSNIGHLDTAAGVASLIKASLAVYHRQLPPSLNFEAPNPAIDFRSSPFYVNDQLRPWTRGAENRRAAINSLGVGGTNAFAIVEEPPERAASTPAKRPYQLLVLSARNKAALDGNAKRLAAFLTEHPQEILADVAYSLVVGRRAFDQRRLLACKDREEAIALLESHDSRRVITQKVGQQKPSIVFMFPGGGAQYPRMGLDLYETEPIVRELMDRGLDWLKRVDFDYRRAMFPVDGDLEWSARELQRPSVQLPLIFLLELALAKLWMSWGVQPDSLIGHSLGENTAACLADVLSFEDGLGLVTLRGQLFERVPEGGMVSVALPVDELRPLLGDDLDVATVNSPGFCVASGPAAALDALEKTLAERGVDAKRVPISIAAHSRMVDPILKDFGAFLRSIKLSPPKIPFISNRTGGLISDELATDPQYWVDHLRHTVMFADGVATLLKTPGRVFIEAGPGKTLGSLARQHPDMKPGQPIIPSLRHPEEKVSDAAFFLTSLGQLWATGAAIDLTALWKDERRNRIPLPTYAYQRQRFWIEPGKPAVGPEESIDLTKRSDVRDWGFVPVWKERPAEPAPATKETASWLVFLDGAGVGSQLIDRLRRRGDEVITVREGDVFFKAGVDDYILSPEHGREGYSALIRELVGAGKVPSRILHLWLLTADESFRPGSSFFHRNQERGFYSLFFLAQALGEEGVTGPRHLTVVGNGMAKVATESLAYPEKSTVLGPCKVIPREFPGYTCSCVDVVLPQAEKHRSRWGRNGSAKADPSLVDQLERELSTQPACEVLALRDGRRYRQEFDSAPLDPVDGGLKKRIRERGVYVITGGLGGIGGALAELLAKTVQARLVLVGRTELPDRGQWQAWLDRKSPEDLISRRLRRIRELEALGGEVLPVTADVTDIEAMQDLFTAVRERFGAVHGVIHAAGVLKDGLIQVKNQADIEEVFAPKIHGTLVLDSILRDENLDFVVLFSSTSTITAPAGQVDYVAANEFLNAYAKSRAGDGQTQVVAVNWGVWSGVGMAAETAARMDRDATPAATEHSTTHPLFDSRSTDSHGAITLVSQLSPKTHWVLDEHRTRTGHAVMPGTGFLEIARAALAECGEAGSFEIADLYFFRALAVGDDETKEARVRLHPNDSGYQFEVQSKATLEDGRVGWENHAQARLLLRPLPDLKPLDIAAIRARCTKRAAHDAQGIRSKQETEIIFGPRWRVLKDAYYGVNEAVGRLELPGGYLRDLPSFGLHPAMLDFATGFVLDSTAAYGESEILWVPLSYRSARIHAPLTPKLWSWVRIHGQDKQGAEFISFDIVITDDAGRVLVEIDEFTMKRLPSDLDFGAALVPSAGDLEFEVGGAGSRTNLSPAELAFKQMLQNGILPQEGVEAFTRVLGNSPPPQIVVTSVDLRALIRQADLSAKETRNTDAKFERPALDSEYVEPRDDVDRTLVGFWEELLGVDRVGIRDSFFDLGGHSLIAVRLFAKIKKTYQVEYPISVLFNAPTIEQCAALIHEAIGKGEGKDAGSPQTASKLRYRHLVPMHAGDKGAKTPFFLVAGMFGNVLNLRHLAHLLGADRPFYGVQARGLYGDDQPHESFEEMASDYLAEIRTVQPHGPYMIGGFSGGGIAAWEMSRQLREAGEDVSLLVLLDTPLPTQPPLSKTDKLQIHWQSLRRQGPSYVTDWAKRRLERHADGNGHAPKELSPAEFRSEAIKDAFYRALPKYPLQRHDGTVVLFRPKLDAAYHLADGRVLSRSKDVLYPDNGWTPYCDRVEVHEVPGDHDSMVLEPNVRTMAQKLKKCLLAAESRTLRPVVV